jgi:hypothetical protein
MTKALAISQLVLCFILGMLISYQRSAIVELQDRNGKLVRVLDLREQEIAKWFCTCRALIENYGDKVTTKDGNKFSVGRFKPYESSVLSYQGISGGSSIFIDTKDGITTFIIGESTYNK